MKNKHVRRQTLQRLIGREPVERLVAKFGGMDGVYIPAKANPNHRFVPVIGEELFARIVTAFPKTRITLSAGRPGAKRAAIVAALGDMPAVTTDNEIARSIGCTVRYVRMVRRSVGDARKSKESSRDAV